MFNSVSMHCSAGLPIAINVSSNLYNLISD